MNEWIELIVAICGAISVIVPMGISLFNKTKELFKEKNYSTIFSLMKDLATKAEGLYTSGAEKQKYVLDGIKVTCDNLGVEYDEARFNDELTKLIDATKNINTK